MSVQERRLSLVRAPTFRGSHRFELRRVLGEGSMGVVHEAYDHERQMIVALKTGRWVDAQSLVRLKREFRGRADLEHRNLVRLFELHEDQGHWFFTMERVDGADFLTWARAADERALRTALRQLASGLDALHRAGMVHRDLKPSNVMVTPRGRVVILDFGLVRAEGDASDRTPVGTVAYMAPEQAMGDAVGPAADCYSLGVMLHEALTGALPVDGTALEILVRKQQAPAPEVRGVPPDLAALCRDLLAVDPLARPSAAEVLGRLAAVPEPPAARAAFVGRARELAALEQAWAEVRAGATRAACIEGESGIGKSMLVRRFTERVGDEALVLAGRCHERETVPFKGFDGIVDALARELARREGGVPVPPPGELAALVQTFPVLLRVPAYARPGALPANLLERRGRAFRGLRRILEALAAERPLLLAIDDVQWADADTLALLGDVVHAPGAPRMLAILTRRGDGAPPSLPVPTRRLALAPLSADEAAELVARVAPERAHETSALVAEAGGHPMFLRELLRHGATARGLRLDDALWARITRLDLPARRALELCAIAGRPIPQAILADALRLDGRAAAKWFGALRAAQLVRTGGVRGADPIEPYHDRVREAVLARLPPARRRRGHERLAALLLAIGWDAVDPLTIVDHLVAAGNRRGAADLARRAVRRQDDALAFEQVAALCAAALSLGGVDVDPAERRDLLARRAEALACAGRGREAAEAYLEAAEGATADVAFERRRAAAEQLLVSGHVAEGLALLGGVLDAIGERLPRGGAAAQRGLAWRWLLLGLRGTRWRPRPAGAGGLLDLRLDVYRTGTLGLGLIDPVVGADFGARAALAALRRGDPRRISYALAYHAIFVAASGRGARARALHAQAAAIADAEASPFLLASARAAGGVIAYFAGDFAGAADQLIQAEEQMREHTIGSWPELNHLRLFLLFALRRLGAFGRLRAHYLEYLRDALARGDRYAATSIRWSSNVVWLAGDDVARARDDLDAATWEGGAHLQHWFLLRSRAELALYEGDAAACAEAEAALAAVDELGHVLMVRVETALDLARLAIARRDAGAARRALARLRRDRAPHLRCLVEPLAAAADLLEGGRERARARLVDAIAAAELAGTPVVGALARRALAMIDGVSTREADEVLAKHGVVNVERWAATFAPWPA